jgi:hypothetical protein
MFGKKEYYLSRCKITCGQTSNLFTFQVNVISLKKVTEQHWLLQELKIIEYSLYIKVRRTLLLICSYIGRCRRPQSRKFRRPNWSRICITNVVSLYPRLIWRARKQFWWMRRLGFLVVLLVFPYHFQPNISLVLRMPSQVDLIFELIFCKCRSLLLLFRCTTMFTLCS